MTGIKRAAGFTLVELLVVVTIITIMAALLLPTLYRTRDMARTSTCLSNQKQIGLAELMYCDEYGGADTFRWAPCDAEWDRNSWWNRVLRGKYGGTAYLPRLPWSQCYSANFYRYMGVTLCQARYVTGAAAGSYCINAGSNLFLNRIRLAKLPKPSIKIWFTCDGDNRIVCGPPGYGYRPAASWTHHNQNTGTTVLFFDNHARFILNSQAVAETYPEGWNNLPNYSAD